MPGYKELLRDIKANHIAKLYVFHGEEAYLREHCTERLRQAVLTDESFNFNRFAGKGLTLQELSDAAESVPFLSEKKLVLVDDFDLMGIPASDRDRWVTFLGGLPDSCCLVFRYDTLTYKPDGRSKIQAALNKHAVIVAFETQEDSHLCGWIAKHFSAKGKRIDRPLCEYMIFRCGRSMTALTHEIDKIAAYTDGEAITRESLDEVTEPVLEAAVFDLTDAVSAGNMKKAAQILQTLQWMREPPEVILGAIGRTLRGLYAARLAIDYKKTTRQVMEACGYRSTYPAEKLMRAARGFSAERCRSALRRCREADAMLKGEGRERALEWFLGALAL